MKLLSFGEILWDVYPDIAHIGGAPLNFAAHFSKLGGNSYMLSAIGKDNLGKEALKKLENWNVKTDFVFETDYETGKCLVTLNDKGVPNYNLLENFAWDYIDFTENVKDFDLLYFGTLALRKDHNIKTVKKLLHYGDFKEIFVDVNIRPPFFTEETINFALNSATILKISDEELPIVLSNLKAKDWPLKEICKSIKNKFENLKIIIITLGAKGSYCFNCETETEYDCVPKETTVVSTVGAGDSFSAAFCIWLRHNRDKKDSRRRFPPSRIFLFGNLR